MAVLEEYEHRVALRAGRGTIVPRVGSRFAWRLFAFCALEGTIGGRVMGSVKVILILMKCILSLKSHLVAMAFHSLAFLYGRCLHHPTRPPIHKFNKWCEH